MSDHAHCYCHGVNLAANMCSSAPSNMKWVCCHCGGYRPDSIFSHTVMIGGAGHGPYAPKFTITAVTQLWPTGKEVIA